MESISDRILAFELAGSITDSARAVMGREIDRLALKAARDLDVIKFARIKELRDRLGAIPSADPTTSAAPDAPTVPTRGADDGQAEPGAKSAQAKFTSPTTPDRFTTWLENHTQAAYTQAGGWFGGYSLQPARRMFRTDKRNIWRMAAVSDDADIENAISFEIEDLAAGRIEITAECIFSEPSPVYKYFCGLLVAIGDKWTEAREGINRAFGVTDAAPDALTLPTSGKMIEELSQRFVFNADAQSVCEYIAGLKPHPKRDHGRPAITVADENFTCACEFLIGARRDALYTFELSVSVWWGKPDDDIANIWEKMLLCDYEPFGEITLRQEKAGECEARLYLADNPRYANGKPLSPAMLGISTRLIVDVWRGLISGWLARPTLPTSGTGNGQDKTKSTLSPEYRAKLRHNLATYFGREDLRDLCFDLGIPYENFPERLDSMAREIIAHCERVDHISALVAKCKERRPNVSWDDMPDAARKV